MGPPPAFSPMDPSRAFRHDSVPPPPKGYPHMYPPPPMMGPYPHPPPMMHYGPHYLPMHGPPGAYGMPPPPFPPQPGVAPPYPPGPPVMQPPLQNPSQPASPHNVRAPSSQAKGTDPHGHDMSSPQALAKNFGVSDIITSGLKLDPVHELPVNPDALPKLEVSAPRDSAHWVTVSIHREPPTGDTPNTLSLLGPISKSPQVVVWLPKDRKFGKYIIDIYFKRLNIHRPVYARKNLDKILDDLYEGVTPVHDPGHLYSIYIIFALGTLSELNHRAVTTNLDAEKHQSLGSSVARKLMPPDWPTHDEFFERALNIQPELRVSITSLQALILLHWYLYIEVSIINYPSLTFRKLIST